MLLNSAGTFAAKPFTKYTAEELDQFLSNLRGTYLLSQAVVEPTGVIPDTESPQAIG